MLSIYFYSIILEGGMIWSSSWRLFRMLGCILFFELVHLLLQNGILGESFYSQLTFKGIFIEMVLSIAE